jgi:hypothetical protein
MTGTVNLDGRKVGTFVAEHAGKVLSGPQTGPSTPDRTASPDFDYFGVAP